MGFLNNTAFLLLLSGCAAGAGGGAPDRINDPYEAQNRKVHAFNLRLDSGGSGGGITGSYSRIVPQGIRQNVSNFSETLGLPGSMVNHALQGDILAAGGNLLRFALNATLGFGGLADVASDLELKEDKTDFGETLYVWGLPEGAYQELPVLGPSTRRDTAGRVADLFLNPLTLAMTPVQRGVAFGAKVASKLDKRARFGDSIDAVLYDSADSYAQTRIIWLQNRRFELGDTGGGAGGIEAPEDLNTEGF